MSAEDDADLGQAVVVVVHVQWSHGHDQGHHELADDQRDQRGHDRRSTQDLAKRSAVGHVGGSFRGDVGQLEWVGTQQTNRQQCRQSHEQHGHEIGSGELGQSQAQRDPAGGLHEVRSHDRADRRAPYDRADRRCATCSRVHVGSRVPRQLVGAVPKSDEEGRCEEQRERPDDHGQRGAERSADTDQVPGGQPRATASGAGHETG